VKYDPERHHRRSIRLRGYDYSETGAYFVTICSFQRECLFGRVVDAEVELSQFGEVAASCWSAIPQHFSHVELDCFVVMPNHVHGIVVVTENLGGTAMPCPYGRSLQGDSGGRMRKFGDAISGSLPTIVGSFKSAVTQKINILRNSPRHPVWQRNYYEHVIRNDTSLTMLRQYICNNPSSWNQDQLHPDLSSKW
jgi:REP element-mobilizing transposase RayT